ncbi:Olfactory receptor 5V1 [Heterocephalus glaber]|uniref:Olfactory receptor 5V1 n=1 Tax=Heterocephalus glaber TaxID=10181 RepID=G5C121_HETGA|nr:Olfactory receptor 5V1 [Heterocephalus glaber]
MDVYNVTSVTQFILIGLSDFPKVRYPLFVVFAIIYELTLVGNRAILLAFGTEAKLHTPMYYFLVNLPPLDIFCPSTTVPKILHNLLNEDHSISFVGCALQLYFWVFLAGTEVFLLAVMVYDQYVAICFPLCCSVIITKAYCAQLYYCDISPVVALSCSSTYVAEMLAFMVEGISAFISFLTILISYVYITILKIQVAEGKHKAFLTLASHLLVVCLFYGTAIFTYIRTSSSQHFPARDRLISVLYGVITLMLTPVIYSLRNMEVKKMLMRAVYCRMCLR